MVIQLQQSDQRHKEFNEVYEETLNRRARYIPKSVEDITIREAIDSIYDMLVELPKEKRLAFFEQISKPKDLDFLKEIDGIYYVILSHFNRDKNEDMVDKVNRILNNGVWNIMTTTIHILSDCRKGVYFE